MLPCICPVIDLRGRQNVVGALVTHSAMASCATFLFLPLFDVNCDLLLNRCTETWNLFVKYIYYIDTSVLLENTLPVKITRNYIRDSSDAFSRSSSLSRILMISMLKSLSFKLFFNSLVYDWNIFGSSLKVFGNLRQCLGIFGKCSGKFMWPSDRFSRIFGNLRKVVEKLRKIVKNAVIRMSI